MAVFDIKSTGDFSVHSSQLQIPANTVCKVGFETSNTDPDLDYNQGVLMDFGNGLVAVKYAGYQPTPYYYPSGWRNRTYPLAAMDRRYGSGRIYGPCKLTFFS
jgi:hypothetical protein